MSGLAATLVRDAEALGALEGAWWDLWRRIPGATPFTSPAWLLPWWTHFRPGELRTVAVWHGHNLVALAPLYLEDGPFGRRLLPLGIGISDVFDVLVAPEEAGLASERLMAAIVAMDDWDALSLEELPPGAAALDLPAPPGTAEERAPHSVCPALPLDPGGVPIAARVSKRQRQHILLARNRALRRGEIRVEQAGAAEVAGFLDVLVAQHGARWRTRGEGGALADPRVVAFHAEAAPRLQAAGLLRLSLLSIGGAPAATHYGFHHQDAAYVYLTGIDPEQGFESPGVTLFAAMIDGAIAEGARVFHFLRGQEAYKYGWGAVDRWNAKRVIARASAAS